MVGQKEIVGVVGKGDLRVVYLVALTTNPTVIDPPVIITNLTMVLPFPVFAMTSAEVLYLPRYHRFLVNA